MKKPNPLSPRKEHNVDILRRVPRSAESGQDALPRPMPPMEPAPAGAPVRQVRHRLVEEAEGCPSVIQRRRSPRRDAQDEDRDFEPEVPVRRAKTVSKAVEAQAPKPKSYVQGASASKNKGKKSFPVSSPPSSEDEAADVDVTDAEASGKFL